MGVRRSPKPPKVCLAMGWHGYRGRSAGECDRSGKGLHKWFHNEWREGFPVYVSRTAPGWTAGGGAEIAVTPNISVSRISLRQGATVMPSPSSVRPLLLFQMPDHLRR